MSGLADWLRDTLPLQPVVLDHAIEQARRNANSARLSESALLQTLQSDPRALERLVAEVVPPETWLFRHPAAFECVREQLRSVRNGTARMLSLGCATGAEAFSLAASARDAGHDASSCEIVAVDWNEENLKRAAEGTCPPLAQRGPLPAWATRHFETDPRGCLRPVREALAMIRWVHDDITGDRLPSECDVVFCRNVAIYLGESARDRLARNLAACTRACGLLCLGHADPPRLWAGSFQSRSVPGAFAYERLDAPAFQASPATPEAVRAPVVAIRPTRAESPSRPPIQKAQELADAGAPGEAIKILDQLVRTSAVDADAWQLLGSAQLARGAPQEAEACFRKVVYLQPDHALALLQLSVFAEERGDREGADRMRARAARALKGETP